MEPTKVNPTHENPDYILCNVKANWDEVCDKCNKVDQVLVAIVGFRHKVMCRCEYESGEY